MNDADYYYDQWGRYGTPSANPTNCMVSPVFKSDVNELNPEDGTPAVNALGERRGLMAFKILGAGDDPDGSGSVLPNLWIEICDPVDLLGAGGLAQIGFGTQRIRLVE